uniref:Uncharacterized protein n=1 Tax=Timema douglasi TaxID=61478 RepID=A0A7R8ZCR3_TIMDO|nr:unnamed protein product [Timema douglasi]
MRKLYPRQKHLGPVTETLIIFSPLGMKRKYAVYLFQMKKRTKIHIKELNGYHYSYWSQEQLYIPGETAVHLPVDAPISLSGERDLCCMGGFPDATTDDEFSPDFMTG